MYYYNMTETEYNKGYKTAPIERSRGINTIDTRKDFRRIPATQISGTVTRRSNSVPIRRAYVSTETDGYSRDQQHQQHLLPPVVGGGVKGVRGLLKSNR